MSFWGYLVFIIATLIIWNYGKNNQWSSTKSYITIVIASFICYTIFGNNLHQAGEDYILEHLKSPSSAIFHSHTSSRTVKKKIKADWGIELPKNCDIILIDVEAENGFGGRNRTTYAVFFKDKEPVDMIDADGLNKMKLNSVLSWLDF